MLLSKLSRSSRSLRPPPPPPSSSMWRNFLHCGNRSSPSIIIPGGGIGCTQVGFVRSYLTSIGASNSASAAKTQLINPSRFPRFFSTVPNKKSRAERVRAVIFGKGAKAKVGRFTILIVLWAVFVLDDEVSAPHTTSTSEEVTTSLGKELPAPAAVTVKDSCAEPEPEQKQPTSPRYVYY